MTIFNVGGGGGSELTFKKMTTEPYEIKESDWGDHYTKVRDYCFMNDALIESIEIPSGFTEIGVYAFAYSNVRKVILSNSITSLNTSIFDHCSNLQKCKLSAGLTNIPGNTFNYCTNLTDVSIPNGVTTIGGNAFNNCTALPDITIPNSVTTIGTSAFAYCQAFEIVVIPSSVTSILSNAFERGRLVTSLTINNNVSLNIGNYAFRYLGNSTDGVTITLTGTTPPTISSNTFNNARIDKIIVPAGTLSTYQNATNWTAYAQYMEEAP